MALLDRSADIVALDDALTTLAKVDQRQSQIVELRFFGGSFVFHQRTRRVRGRSALSIGLPGLQVADA